MNARSPAEAVNLLLSHLQRAVSTITEAVLVVSRGGYHPSADPHALTLDTSVRLQSAERISLRLTYNYFLQSRADTPGSWRASMAGYFYTFLDAEHRELLGYHWHPEGRSHVRTPHLHLGPAARMGNLSLGSAHVPTGMVVLPDVIRFAITELGVRPLRADWSGVLASASAALQP